MGVMVVILVMAVLQGLSMETGTAAGEDGTSIPSASFLPVFRLEFS